MKKFAIVLLVLLVMSVPLLAGCANVASAANSPVKTGLAVETSFKKSKPVAADADGVAQVDTLMVAVTVGDNGVIDDCVIDTVQTKINFAADGTLTTDTAKEFLSKNELGDAYGMKAASSIGKEWYEQAAALSAYVKGKTVKQVAEIALDGNGKATDADILSSATVSISGYLAAIQKAAENAVHLGAEKGDTLKLGSMTNIAKSKDATADADGTAQGYTTIGAFTIGKDVITSCYFDAVQGNVKFNTKGEITSDIAASAATKNELKDGYGMKAASAIGKEWYEQADAFAKSVMGKTVAEATSIAVEDGKAVDMVSSVTIGVDEFLAILAK